MLQDAHLQGVDCFQADFRRADLSGANLWEANLRSADLYRAILGGANLRLCDLSLADLRNTDLKRANLSGAFLESSNLRQARLVGARMDGANLTDTDFGHANASAASFREANLTRANLAGVDLTGANFAGAQIRSVVFGNNDLSHVEGLESATHLAPSTIGLDTIFRSKGKIPESFLRGAGVPENFITYMKSLTGAAFEFYSCFISYSTKDQAFADRLYADLQAKGVRCWFARHDIQGGKKVHEQIDEAIRVYDKLLLILSDASMNSKWVKTEIANARAREEQQKRQMLFPITLVPFDSIRTWKCFDADTGVDSARDIREYFVPDFSNWKDHDSYTASLERLVRDLKAGPAADAATDTRR